MTVNPAVGHVLLMTADKDRDSVEPFTITLAVCGGPFGILLSHKQMVISPDCQLFSERRSRNMLPAPIF